MIDEKKMIHTRVYDDEHEEWIDKEMTIAEYLDAYTEEGCPESKLQPCEDAVSREAIMSMIEPAYSESGYLIDYVISRKKIAELPPVTPKQRTGKWIHEEDALGYGGYYRCSCCGKSALYRRGVMKMLNEKTTFCPRCGAKMEGVSE